MDEIGQRRIKKKKKSILYLEDVELSVECQAEWEAVMIEFTAFQ